MTSTSRQRQERILAELYAQRFVTPKALAALTAVSEATVRRDLKALADAHEIDLVHGGATLPRRNDFSWKSKEQRNVEAKRVIGRLAAELVRDDDQIFLDSGTTCFEMIPFIKARQRLSVIVNSARLALELDAQGLSVLMLGGQYRPARMDTVGPLAAYTLDQLRGYVCFIGADGVNMQFGLSAADIESADLNRRASQHARQTVLLADHTKFATASLFKIVEWRDVARLVTDQEPTPEWMEFLSAQGIQVDFPENS